MPAAVAAKILQAQKNVPPDAINFVPQVIRYCWMAPLSPKEIAEVRGLTGLRTLSRWTTVCKATEKVGLLSLDADGRYRVNQDEIKRLKVLSELRR